MIEALKLRNFKCFRDHQFNFKPLTILAGSNATGKSSIIQSILLAYQTIKEKESGKQWVDINKSYDIHLGKATSVRSNNFVGDPNTINITLDYNAMQYDFLYKIDENVYPNAFYINNCKLDEFANSNIRYLKAERVGPRLFTSMNSQPYFLGYNGEYVASVIAQADLIEMNFKDKLISEDKAKYKLSAQVEKWMSVIISDLTFTFNNDAKYGISHTHIQNSVSNEPVLPTATGFGVSYALSIVAAGMLCSAEHNPILIVENPEAHLHPAGQSNMGKFLALLASCGIQVIVETHSEHIVDGARIQLLRNNETEMLNINFFDVLNDEVIVYPINLKSNGELSNWPEGFFDQRQIDLKELLELKLNAIK